MHNKPWDYETRKVFFGNTQKDMDDMFWGYVVPAEILNVLVLVFVLLSGVK